MDNENKKMSYLFLLWVKYYDIDGCILVLYVLFNIVCLNTYMYVFTSTGKTVQNDKLRFEIIFWGWPLNVHTKQKPKICDSPLNYIQKPKAPYRAIQLSGVPLIRSQSVYTTVMVIHHVKCFIHLVNSYHRCHVRIKYYFYINKPHTFSLIYVLP